MSLPELSARKQSCARLWGHRARPHWRVSKSCSVRLSPRALSRGEHSTLTVADDEDLAARTGRM